MLTRRKLVAGCVSTWLASNCHCTAMVLSSSGRTPNTFGCCLANSDVSSIYPQNTDTRLFATGNEPMIPKSGDSHFDLALAQTLAKISDVFDVLPGFAYYDDYDGKNAYATPVVRLNRGDGTVLFGQGMLAELRAGQDHPEIGVTAVCAHEFGHILQYKHGLIDPLMVGQRTVRRVELQADFFAGYFGAIRKQERPSFPAAVIAQTQHGYGDYHVDNEGHHGTPEERSAAVVAGFRAGRERRMSVTEIVEVGNNYARSI